MAENNIIKINRCKTCGGELVFVDDTYYCQYCENAYKGENFQDSEGNNQTRPAQNPTQLSENSGVNVFEDNIDGILEITWSDEKCKYSGSGYIISQEGYAITNTHVVTHENGESCNRVTVRVKNTETSATVITLGDNRQ